MAMEYYILSAHDILGAPFALIQASHQCYIINCPTNVVLFYKFKNKYNIYFINIL